MVKFMDDDWCRFNPPKPNPIWAEEYRLRCEANRLYINADKLEAEAKEARKKARMLVMKANRLRNG